MSQRALIFLLCALYASCAATPTTAPSQDMQLLHPHIITIERLEHLLRRAGEIFGVASEDAATAASEEQPAMVAQPQPQQHMLPPTQQPYNFYMPLFDYVDPKLDAKSRRMEKIAPPPPPTALLEQNYYAAKPKKTSKKKFNAATKHVNLKWLNTYEKAMGGGGAPKAMYLEQDERNRINFDDSFFAVDMQLAMPDNQPHRQQPAELLQHGEELPEEDLMAAPAQLSYDYKAA